MYPVEVVGPPGGTGHLRESDPNRSGQLELGNSAPGTTESPQNAGRRDTTPAGQAGIPKIRPKPSTQRPGSDESGGQDLRGIHEQSVPGSGPTRAGGEDSGQGIARHPHTHARDEGAGGGGGVLMSFMAVVI